MIVISSTATICCGWNIQRKNKTPYPQIRFIFGGVQYRWCGFFGCQLESREWRTLPAGTTREFKFDFWNTTTMTVFSTKREGLKVKTTWAVSKRGTHDEQLARIRGLKAALASLI